MSTSNFLGAGTPQFSRENYHIWAIKMKTYLMALNLWEAVEDDGEPEPLGADPTLSQIKTYEDKKARKPDKIKGKEFLKCFSFSLYSALKKT